MTRQAERMGRSSETEDTPLIKRLHNYGNISHSEPRKYIPKKQTSQSLPSRRVIIKGYICMLLAMLGYTASLSSAQVSGNKISIFIVNIFRFVFEILFSLVCISSGGHSLKVSKKDTLKLIIAAVLNLVYVTLFYLSSTLLPVGNLDGIFSGIYIATTTLVDAIKQQISKCSVFGAIIAGTGVILLTQPWHSFKGISVSPCDYIDHHYALNISIMVTNSTTGSVSMTVNPLYQWVTSETLGYIYVTLGTLSTCVADNIIRSLLQTYTIYNFLFWAGIIQSVITGCIIIGLSLFPLTDLSFPTGTACLSFGIVFIITMTLSHMLLNVTFVYLPVSKSAMVTPVATIALYVIQRTLLKVFHPGHANAMEIVGIVSIIIASILSPVVSIFYESGD